MVERIKLIYNWLESEEISEGQIVKLNIENPNKAINTLRIAWQRGFSIIQASKYSWRLTKTGHIAAGDGEIKLWKNSIVLEKQITEFAPI